MTPWSHYKPKEIPLSTPAAIPRIKAENTRFPEKDQETMDLLSEKE
jgi:hypothetical protein